MGNKSETQNLSSQSDDTNIHLVFLQECKNKNTRYETDLILFRPFLKPSGNLDIFIFSSWKFHWPIWSLKHYVIRNKYETNNLSNQSEDTNIQLVFIRIHI